MPDSENPASLVSSTTSIPDDVYDRCKRCGWQVKDLAKLAELVSKRKRGLLPYLHILSFELQGKEYIVVDATRDDGTGWRGVDFGPVIDGTPRYAPNTIKKITGETPTVIYTDNPNDAAERWGFDLQLKEIESDARALATSSDAADLDLPRLASKATAILKALSAGPLTRKEIVENCAGLISSPDTTSYIGSVKPEIRQKWDRVAADENDRSWNHVSLIGLGLVEVHLKAKLVGNRRTDVFELTARGREHVKLLDIESGAPILISDGESSSVPTIGPDRIPEGPRKYSRSPASDNANAEASQLARDASDLISAFYRLTSGGRPKDWVKRSMDLTRVATSSDQFGSWISNANSMVTNTLEFLPSSDSDIFDAVRIFDDCLRGRRLPQYEIERRWLSKNDIQIQRLRDLSESTVERLQRSILRVLIEELEQSLNEKEQLGDRAHWMTTLRVNKWHDSVADRLSEAVRLFAQQHESAVWPATGESVFSEDSKNRLLSQWHGIAEPCSRKNWQQVWGELFEVSKTIVTLTTEGHDEAVLRRFRATLKRDWSVFEILWSMRHRDAHGTSYSHLPVEKTQKVHEEWTSTQRWIAKRIGRVWKGDSKSSRTSFFDEDSDLHLTAFEGTHAKLELLDAVNRALSVLQGDGSAYNS